jgi:acetylornithine deacetylase/succinyl-diaminopimelate desuccinylase-like protein
MPTEKMPELKKQFEFYLKGIDVKYKIIRKQFPYSIDPNESLVEDVRNSMKTVIGYEPKLFIAPSRTDSTYLYQMNKTKTAIMGPGEQPMCHQPNEWIDTRRMNEFTYILLDFLK